MKRLAILSLVLCISSLASAAISLDINGSAIGLRNDAAGSYETLVVWSQNLDNHLIAECITPLGIGVPTQYHYSGIYEGGIFNMADTGLALSGAAHLKAVEIHSLEQIQPGIHYTAEFRDLAFGRTDYGAGYVCIFDAEQFLMADRWVILDTVYVVPEPATLMLLGLGALTLTRTRKR